MNTLLALINEAFNIKQSLFDAWEKAGKPTDLDQLHKILDSVTNLSPMEKKQLLQSVGITDTQPPTLRSDETGLSQQESVQYEKIKTAISKMNNEQLQFLRDRI